MATIDIMIFHTDGYYFNVGW